MFKKQTGITIFEYLNRIRINKAKELLLTGTMNPVRLRRQSDIVMNIISVKQFKKAAGVSPRKYLEGNHVLTSEKKEGILY